MQEARLSIMSNCLFRWYYRLAWTRDNLFTKMENEILIMIAEIDKGIWNEKWMAMTE
jgi:hypothetical protein